jgi:hypothetical protein
MRFAVPQFQALHDAVAIQWNRAASAAGPDYFSHFQRLRFPIAIVDHDVVELNGRMHYAKLQEAVAAGRGADLDVIVIMLAIDMGLTQENPPTLGVG